MGGIKKKKRYQGLRKYNRIVSYLVNDRKKRKIPYEIAEIRQLASSIYPNFRETQFSKISKRAVVSGKPIKKVILPKKEEKLPTFPSELNDPDQRYYWGVFDMLTLIQNATLKEDNLFFNSEIAGQEELLIQGGVKFEPTPEEFYKQNFKNFVNFLDLQRKADKIDLGSGSELRIIATQPVKDKDRWISTIKIVNQDGNEDLSADLTNVLDEYIPEQSYEGSTKAKQQKQPSIKLSASEKLELEKIQAQERVAMEQIKSNEKVRLERVAKMDKYYQDALAGKITWERYDKLVDDLFREK
jgi:hypothetical protein